MKITFYLETLGCAKNRYDSEIMLGKLLGSNYQYIDTPEKATIIIINTCAFLTSAVEESIQRILELAIYKKTGICQKLIVVGCLTERYRHDLIDELPEVDTFIGTTNYASIIDYLNFNRKIQLLNHRPKYSTQNYNTDRVLSTPLHYAYLKIAEGCSNQCSFCNIPKLRGPLQSSSIPQISKEFNRLILQGVKEINLISQDCSAYGQDLKDGTSLVKLIQQLLKLKNDNYWIRILYAYPNNFPLELLDLMQDDQRIAKYLDLPLQHISNSVLKDMQRHITRSEIEKIIFKIKQKIPDIALRTTFIVGFPTETEQDFEELLIFVKEGYFEHIGIFMYSHEDNTQSFHFGDQIPHKIKQQRYETLMAAQQEISLKKNQSRIGKSYRVLVEGFSTESDLFLQGRTQYQAPEVDSIILINDGKAKAHQFAQVKITEALPYDLVGKIE